MGEDIARYTTKPVYLWYNDTRKIISENNSPNWQKARPGFGSRELDQILANGNVEHEYYQCIIVFNKYRGLVFWAEPSQASKSHKDDNCDTQSVPVPSGIGLKGYFYRIEGPFEGPFEGLPIKTPTLKSSDRGGVDADPCTVRYFWGSLFTEQILNNNITQS